MIGRRLPPTYSPLTASAVFAGRRSGAEADTDQAALRQLLLARYGARDLLLTDSGTSALQVALAVATEAPGTVRLVALPAWSCYDLATAADGAGVDVVLYDLDPGTLAPDWASFDAAMTRRPAAVVLVHPFGVPVAIAEARSRARAAGVVVVEDAAQAIGATVDGRPAGSRGDFGILSFGRGKGWTGGGGGALLLGSGAPESLRLPGAASLAASAGSGSVLFKSLVQWALGRPALYGIPASLPFLGLGLTVYHPPHAPRRPSDAMAAILLATELLIGNEVAVRRRHAERLAAVLVARKLGTVPRSTTTGEPGWLRLPVIPTDEFLTRLRRPEAARHGIRPGYPLALARLPGFAARLRYPVPTPGADLLADRLHTLPTHSLVTDSDLARLEHWLREGRSL